MKGFCSGAGVGLLASVVSLGSTLAAGKTVPPKEGLLFYAPFDAGTRGLLVPYEVGLQSACGYRETKGKVGNGTAVPEGSGLPFALPPFLSRQEGAVALWLRVAFDPRQPAIRSLIDLGKFGKVYQWTGQSYLTFALFYHHLDERHDYSCHGSLDGWRPGRWKHLAITWSWPHQRRRLYFDGQQVAETAIHRLPNVVTGFRVGPQAGVVDELCVYTKEIDANEVARLYAAGQAGKPAFVVGRIPPAYGAATRLPETEPSPPPRFVNWSFAGAEGKANATRAEVTLHGWWRWQAGKGPYDPPDETRWLFRKVPNQSHYGESFPVRDQAFHVPPRGDIAPGRGNLDGVPQWCEREFSIPATWRGRRIVLSLDSLMKGGAVYLNGRLLGALPEENLGADYDLTRRLAWGEPNRLTVFSHGVDGEMRLQSEPASVSVSDAWLITSWRRKRVILKLVIRSTRPTRAHIGVEIHEGKTTVKRLDTDCELTPGLTDVTLSSSWTNPKPWSLNHPYLYDYVVTVKDPRGALLDQTFPSRFGFREIWIAGGDFVLNGHPVHFIGHSNSHLTGASEMGDSEYIRYSLQRWKAAGLNCVTPWQSLGRMPTCHPLLDIADELGMAIFPVVWLPTGETGGETPGLRAKWEKLYDRYVKRYRQHPSVLCWAIGSGAHTYDFCPGVLDGRYDVDSISRAKPLRETWAHVRHLDPTRPVFGLSNGDLGVVWTSMAYQGFDVDLQERENWPLRWSATRRKPLMPCEFSLPCHPDWFTRSRKRSGGAQYHPKNSKSIATEYGAMLLGPGVYLHEPEEYLASLRTDGRPPLSKAYWDVKLLFADTLRAWRAYGISFIYHAEVPNFFTGTHPRFPTVSHLDPRRRQATPESLVGSLQAADELSEFGRRVRAATRPLLAFIGGPEGKFTNKDHAFRSGEEIRKALVLVNDTERSVNLKATWRLRDPHGRVAAQGTVAVSCAPGRQETRAGAVRFVAPTVARRTDFRLEVSAEGVRTSPFVITLFPKTPPLVPPEANRFVLFDPRGDTRSLLRKLGVNAAPPPTRLNGRLRLIIGRRVLSNPENVERLMNAGFDEAVTDGMRVLLFEQAAEGWEGALLGVRMKRLDTRRAFVRCPDHPVLSGLTESDFQYLRGDSNMIPPYPKFPPTPPARYPVHWWHWGNDHIVATYTLEKPQVGAARAVLDCGFDLTESPLLEVARGEGLLLFCQVDVTNRVGVDPVSTRLVINLLRYLAMPAFRPPAGATLRRLRRDHHPAATFHGYFSRAPAIPGVHHGQLFFREKLQLPAFTDSGPTPLFACFHLDGRTYWLPSFTDADLRTEWQRAKLARLETALRFLHGERSDTGPRLRNPVNLYPHDWNYVPDMKVDFDPYVYWRW